MIPQRLLRKVNSQLADGHGLRRPASQEIRIHPEDARHRGIDDGDHVVIAASQAEMRSIARLDDGVLPGVVAIPHGFAEANAADLTSSSDVDPVTGMPQMTSVGIEIGRPRTASGEPSQATED
jgi:assimilatory nitrate reductase catalytic subunit